MMSTFTLLATFLLVLPITLANQNMNTPRPGENGEDHITRGDKECGYNGWVLRSGSELCYKLVGIKLEWEKSKDFCTVQGGSLVSIIDEEENEYIRNLTSHFQPIFWIGLKKVYSQDDVFKWVDNSPFNYSNWVPEKNETAADVPSCAYMIGADGTWKSGPCEFDVTIPQNKYHPYASVCKKGSIQNETEMPEICPSGWTNMEGTTSCYIKQSKNLTFDEALLGCMRKGAHLVSIKSEEENKFVFDNFMSQRTYIGLVLLKLDGENVMHWVADKSPPFYKNWNEDQPVLGLSCVMMDDENGGWWSADCSEIANSVCEKSIYSWCEENWIYLPETGSCYTMTGRYLSWKESQDVCQKMDSHLASVHSQKENDFLFRLGWKHTNQDVWIGFNSILSKNYTWVDQTKGSYDNWEVNEPNKFLGIEKCVKMTGNGTWIDVQCEFDEMTLDEYRYSSGMGVCKKAALTMIEE